MSARPPAARGASRSGSPATSAPPDVGEGAGLYLHIPFCSAVCPYCDFAVRVGAPAEREAFVGDLIRETDLWSDWQTPIDTVYLGGGTPSLLSTDQLNRLLDAARRNLPVRADARVFLEANPEDVTPGAVSAWRALGIATLSLGVQSFDDRELCFLGRRHDGVRGREALAQCLAAGFDTVSLDLIFGLPDQSADTLRASLDTAVALAPHHVSCYQLTVHQRTAFGRRRTRGRLVEMAEDDQAERYTQVHDVLGHAGWTAYEASNFARAPRHRSRHNMKYWRHLPYLGLGPSAHSFDGTRRWWNHRGIRVYRAALDGGECPIAGNETLSKEDLALEALMFGLRTVDGIDLRDFRRRFGIDLVARNRRFIDDCLQSGLLALREDRLAPTPSGLAVADALAARLDLHEASDAR